MKRSPLSRKRPLSSRNGIRPVRRERAQRWDGWAWREAVFGLHGPWSLLSGAPAETAHHCITRQQLRRELPADVYKAAIRDPRNGVPLTNREHERHHSRMAVIPADRLPGSVWEFAADLDRAYGTRLTVWLERTYGEGKAA